MLTDACVCADDQHRKVWTVASKAEDGSFQVLVVTRQIHERDHFRGTLTNLLCSPRLTVIHDLEQEMQQKHGYKSLTSLWVTGWNWILHHLSFAVKAEDFKADARRASSLNLM